jgi:spermidine/putrescine-binding protein
VFCGGFVGCGKKITDEEVGVRTASPTIMRSWFGERIYNKDVRPPKVVPAVPKFTNNRVKLALPKQFYPGSKADEEAESEILADVKRQFGIIWKRLEESVGVVIEPVFFDPENDPPPRDADCAIVSDFLAYDLYLSHLLKRPKEKAVPNAKQIDNSYKAMLKEAVKSSSDFDSAYIGDYCLPYSYSLVGLAVNPFVEKETPRSWRSLFEPRLGTGEIRVYAEKNILFRSAEIYVRSKLLRARDLIGEDLRGVYSNSAQAVRLKRAYLELCQIVNNNGSDLSGLRFPIEELISFLETEVKNQSMKGEIPVDRQASNSEARHATGENVRAGEVFRKLRVHVDALLKVTVAKQSEEAYSGTDAELRAGLQELLEKSISSSAARTGDGLVDDSGVLPTERLSVEELAAMEHFFAIGLELSSGDVAQKVRSSLGLLLSYIQYLPRMDTVNQQFPSASPAESRRVSELVLIVNMLKGQAFSARGQRVLYDNAGGLEIETGGVSVAQMSGGRAAYFLRSQQALNAMRAAERDHPGGLEVLSGRRAIEFVLPEEGCPVRCYHLVMLRESPEVECAINSLLRPDVAAPLSNFFLFGSTEPSVRSLVDREVLNSPVYSIPDDPAQISQPDLDSRTRMAIGMVGDEVKRYFSGAKAQSKEEVPLFPFGIRLRTETIAQFYK